MYIYYKIDNIIEILNPIKIGEELIVRKVKPKLTNFHNILWTVFSLGKFVEYQLINKKDMVLSSAQVMPKIFIFSFMDKNGIHIGPCYTHDNYRGRGYYPYLLTFITSEYKYKNIYIFCEETNISSQKGILKAGFKSFAKGYKSKIGIYKVYNYC
jgi:hypothetical protein